MKNYLQKGDVLTIPAPAAVSAGGVVVSGSLVGVAQTDALITEDVAVATVGVFELPKVDEQAWTLGVPVYWTGTAATTVSTDNDLIGYAAEAVAVTAGLVLGKVKIG